MARERWRVAPTTAYELIDDQAVALNLKSGLYFKLTPVAARALDRLGEGSGLEELLDLIVGEFEVDRPAARADLVELMAELERVGLVARQR